VRRRKHRQAGKPYHELGGRESWMLQGLKPTVLGSFLSELKLRPPKRFDRRGLHDEIRALPEARASRL